MKLNLTLMAWALSVIGAVACQSSQKLEDVTQNDSDDNEADSIDNDDLMSAETDASSKGDTGDTQDSADTTPSLSETIDTSDFLEDAQPISFVISNQTDDKIALPVLHKVADVIYCKDSEGGACYPNNPPCIPSCDTVSPNDDCQPKCDTSSGALEIGPLQKIEVLWDGYIRTIRRNYCADGGACYEVYPPAADSYEFSIAVYADYTCGLMSGTCRWSDSHIYDGGMVSGTETTFSQIVSFPSSASFNEVEFIVDAVQ